MGDHGKGLFVRDGIPAFFGEQALPAADLVTPNLFELERLTGQLPRGIAENCAAAVNQLNRGPKAEQVTRLAEEAAGDEVVRLAVAAEGAGRVATPRLPMAPNGAGDAVAALFLGFWLKTRSVPEALGAAAAAIFELLQTTLESGEEELQLVAA